MASSVTLANPTGGLDDMASRGIRRSRLSVHFNTPRRRRWLLVQLVSMPLNNAIEEQDTQLPRRLQAEAPRPKPWQSLVDDYERAAMWRRCG